MVRIVLGFVFSCFVVILGLLLMFYVVQYSAANDLPWVAREIGVKHIFPWDAFFISLAMIAWGLWDLLLHGDPKARRQAKLDAQRKTKEASAAPPEAS